MPAGLEKGETRPTLLKPTEAAGRQAGKPRKEEERKTLNLRGRERERSGQAEGEG